MVLVDIYPNIYNSKMIQFCRQVYQRMEYLGLGSDHWLRCVIIVACHLDLSTIVIHSDNCAVLGSIHQYTIWIFSVEKNCWSLSILNHSSENIIHFQKITLQMVRDGSPVMAWFHLWLQCLHMIIQDWDRAFPFTMVPRQSFYDTYRHERLTIDSVCCKVWTNRQKWTSTATNYKWLRR